MGDFVPICAEHRELFTLAHTAEPTRSSGDSFGGVYLWDLLCRRNVAWLDGRLGIEFLCQKGVFYTYPAGSGDLVRAVETLERRAAEHGMPLVLKGLTPPQKQALMTAFPEGFDYEDDRANYDYIHDIDSVAALSGKKMHRKRNFCNRFEKSFSWEFRALTPDRFGDCLSVLTEWEQGKDDVNREEAQAIRKAFREWEALGMRGGVLYADGRPAGFTIGDRIAPDMMDVHFEKALADVPGAYPMVAREFARMVKDELPEVRLLNREEDMGLENLRKAKEDWHPLYLLEKTTARRRGTAWQL